MSRWTDALRADPSVPRVRVGDLERSTRFAFASHHGPTWGNGDLTIDLVLADEDRRHRLTPHNGALTHRTADPPGPRRP